MTHIKLVAIAISVSAMVNIAAADITTGILQDFEDGTTQGWTWGGQGSQTTEVVSDGGPDGAGDSFLQLNSGGNAGFFATFNNSINGVVDPAVKGFFVDMMQIPGEDSLEMRLVMMGPGVHNRWTSSVPFTIPSDGIWRNYFFSIEEADLSYVPSSLGGGTTYNDMLSGVSRIMLRHDPGGPSSGGTSAAGTLGVDNFATIAIPEPSGISLILFGSLLLWRNRAKR